MLRVGPERPKLSGLRIADHRRTEWYCRQAARLLLDLHGGYLAEEEKRQRNGLIALLLNEVEGREWIDSAQRSVRHNLNTADHLEPLSDDAEADLTDAFFLLLLADKLAAPG